MEECPKCVPGSGKKVGHSGRHRKWATEEERELRRRGDRSAVSATSTAAVSEHAAPPLAPRLGARPQHAASITSAPKPATASETRKRRGAELMKQQGAPASSKRSREGVAAKATRARAEVSIDVRHRSVAKAKAQTQVRAQDHHASMQQQQQQHQHQQLQQHQQQQGGAIHKLARTSFTTAATTASSTSTTIWDDNTNVDDYLQHDACISSPQQQQQQQSQQVSNSVSLPTVAGGGAAPVIPVEPPRQSAFSVFRHPCSSAAHFGDNEEGQPGEGRKSHEDYEAQLLLGLRNENRREILRRQKHYSSTLFRLLKLDQVIRAQGCVAGSPTG